MIFPLLKKPFQLLGLLFLFLCSLTVSSQSTRIKEPKRLCNIKSTDNFVKSTFKLYEKVFVYDSLTLAGVEVPTELEEELLQSAEQDIDSLLGVVPDIIDDISDASFMKQARATLNLNKAKRALKYCGVYVKTTILGEKEEGDEED